MSAPIILVPGFWLGAWAWDEVAAKLRADGHAVTALTLPGLESADADRSTSISPTTSTRSSGRSRRPTLRSSLRSTAPAASRAMPRATACPSGSPRWSTSTPRPGSRRSSPTSRDAEKPLAWDELVAEENLAACPRSRRPSSASERCRSRVRCCARLRVHERRPTRHPLDDHRDRLLARPTTRSTPRSTRIGRSSPGSPSSTTSPGSTCRRATGRCGRARRSSPRSSATLRRRLAGSAA